MLALFNVAGNLAYFQPATQSVRTCGGEENADKAVDDKDSKSCTTTSDTKTPAWWQVDLGDIKSINSV